MCDLAEHFWRADNKVSQKCYVAGVCALLFTTVYLGYGWYLAHHVWEQDYEITTEKMVGNLRVVQFADSHVGSTFHADGFEKHLEAIQQLQPYEYPEQEAAGADLVLSGHTHGGQLFPVNHMGEWTHIDAKTYGYEKRGNTNFIVTSGISDWTIKFRTGCRAEFVVVDIVEK